ncbi:MAG: nucleoside deaminase [Deltaproteobacteria bacterium]|nr:nucleoside deaminase [Deltaproteobacteria bacterium]
MEFNGMNAHEYWMQEALMEAATAAARGEVPVGAVAVAENEVIASAHNRREESGNPLDHAEMILLGKINRDHGNWRFDDVTIYCTCEPCLMCMGALVHARIPRLVFGCFEPKTGACGSLYDFSRDRRLNHNIEVIPGVLHDQCALQLRQFFQTVRQSGPAQVKA